MNTRELATRLGNQPHTLHAAYCRNGHYFGVFPEKLPNGTLLWPDDAVERLVEAAKKTPPIDKCKKAREVKAAKRAADEASRIATESDTSDKPKTAEIPRPGRPRKDRTETQATTAVGGAK